MLAVEPARGRKRRRADCGCTGGGGGDEAPCGFDPDPLCAEEAALAVLAVLGRRRSLHICTA